MLFAWPEPKRAYWSLTEQQVVLLLEQVVAVVKDPLNIHTSDTTLLWIVQVMDQVVGMPAQ